MIIGCVCALSRVMIIYLADGVTPMSSDREERASSTLGEENHGAVLGADAGANSSMHRWNPKNNTHVL